MGDKLKENYPVDAVITWVDSSDINWRIKINEHLETKIDWDDKKESTRYNSINEIEITILSILKFATYIKNIYLITDNQEPSCFLELKEKAQLKNVNLVLVDHKVIYKGYEQYLPTFNSQSIETMMYRIPTLSEHFVYFNDDFFLINETQKTDFFVDGVPFLRGDWIKFDENNIIKKLFKSKKRKLGATHKNAKEKGAKLAGFDKNYNFHHTPYPLRKSVFEKFYAKNEDVLILNIKHIFRHVDQYVPQGLINHLEIKSNTCKLSSNLALCYIQTYSYFKVRKKLYKADFNKNNVLFMCLQSLETADPKSLKYILKWIDNKLESNFLNEL
ncbi:MAG: hypothetical protein COB98_01415 [Flavobacteriaceae bacterium]|nr:MAG: hypothetical protein COB98_01415 [Flavobacteriaceae bacterium]